MMLKVNPEEAENVYIFKKDFIAIKNESLHIIRYSYARELVSLENHWHVIQSLKGLFVHTLTTPSFFGYRNT